MDERLKSDRIIAKRIHELFAVNGSRDAIFISFISWEEFNRSSKMRSTSDTFDYINVNTNLNLKILVLRVRKGFLIFGLIIFNCAYYFLLRAIE